MNNNLNDINEIWKDLKDINIKYIDTVLKIKDKEISEKRKEMLQDDKRHLITRPPYIELLPEYKTTKKLKDILEEFELDTTFAKFLCKVNYKLYEHQKYAIKGVIKDKKNMIITTGTGSGKTEAFLLPLIYNLYRQQDNNNSPSMKALILYPLNALVEDQMRRLRQWLDSDHARNFLNDNNKAPITFGRYTGKTPKDNSDKTKLENIYNKYEEEDKKYKNKKDYKEKVSLVINPYGNERWYRKDKESTRNKKGIQDVPPDILITNFSMLNVMLMRKAEEKIFENTKRWLQNKNNIFYLVIDELHTYNGSAGTEVAYLLRLFLDRLGLKLGHPQLRILASSASLPSGEEGNKYLADMLGFNSHNSISIKDEIQNNFIEPTQEIKEYFKQVKQENLKIASEQLKNYNTEDIVNFIISGLSKKDTKFIPTEIDKICNKLSISQDNLSKTLKYLSESSDCKKKFRVHYFFRNMEHLWICFDCHKIYTKPQTLCDEDNCKGKVYELFVCRNCGELFVKGYKHQEDNNAKFTNYKKGNEDKSFYISLKKDKVSAKNEIQKIKLEKGIIKNYNNNDLTSYLVNTDNSVCPFCGAEEEKGNGISAHRVGFEKNNQIISDRLFANLHNEQSTDETKLIVFSDSRQGAAKLSAGIQLAHYRDNMRFAILQAMKNLSKGLSNIEKEAIECYENNENNLSEEQRNIIVDICNKLSIKTLFRRSSEIIEDIRIKTQQNISTIKLTKLAAEVCKIFISKEINPAGPKPSVQKTDQVQNWTALIDKSTNYLKKDNDLETEQKNLKSTILANVYEEILMSICSSKNRSFEQLLLGKLTPTLTPTKNIVDSRLKVILELCYRIIGERRRIFIGRGYDYPNAPLPQNIINRTFLENIGLNEYANSQQQDILKNVLRGYFANPNDNDNKYLLDLESLSLTLPKIGDNYVRCETCGAIFLNDIKECCYCKSKNLEKENFSEETKKTIEDSFYTATEEVSNLRCEELTGQTSFEDSQDRQLRFQNTDTNAIDLLSVTTTMEAGVDIGSLSAVIMANVPPYRFNYQQRTGRAGRRGQVLSYAITTTRSNKSHDTFHYNNPERILYYPPNPPYLVMNNKDILCRMAVKEILRLKYENDNLENNNSAVHGNFGTVGKWDRNILEQWIENNSTEIDRIIALLTNENTEEIKEFIKDLPNKIEALIKKELQDCDNRELCHRQNNELSEFLANNAILPLYGFPTRTRNLYIYDRQNNRQDEIQRDIQTAIMEFAPGKEVVKDKSVYTVTGLGYYYNNQGNGNHPISREEKLYKKGLIWSNNREDADYKEIICYEPKGFKTQRVNDFKGKYDWKPMKMSNTYFPDDNNQWQERGNIQWKACKANLYTINDNNGNLFPLDSEYKLNNTSENKFALFAKRTTDIFRLKFNRSSLGINWRIALSSLGYLIRNAAAIYIDIDPKELIVCYKESEKEIMIADKLDNGAGYALDIYKNIDNIFKLLQKGGDYYNSLLSDNHQKYCKTACYDCLMDFYNEFEHSSLNWRIALDMLAFALVKDFRFSLEPEYWKSLITGKIREREEQGTSVIHPFDREHQGKSILSLLERDEE